MNKIIGIVGGMGPKAGESLHADILRNTRAIRDQDHLHIILYTNSTIPDRSDFLTGASQSSPAPEILRSLQMLVQVGCAVLCVPCNTAQSPPIWDVVEAGFAEFAQGAELLNIVTVTADAVVRRHPEISHVGILATERTVGAGIYQAALSERNVHSIVPSESNQRHVQEAIFHPDWGIKAESAPVTREAIDRLHAAALRMIADGAEAIILGCTEIPLAFTGRVLKGVPLIDSTDALARESIRRAAGDDKLVPLVR
jgi:aspartate racemase